MKQIIVLLTILSFISCKNSSKDREIKFQDDDVVKVDSIFSFYKINIVSPRPKEAFDSIKNQYNLPVEWEFSEGNGYASGGLALANASLQIKTYYDTSEIKAEPTEITLLTEFPDTVAYQRLVEMGIKANKPFRREGWGFSVITLPDLKILGDKSNGVYICRYDETGNDRKYLDSLHALTTKRLESVIIRSPNAYEFRKEWEKIPLTGDVPQIEFIEDSISKMEIVIH